MISRARRFIAAHLSGVPCRVYTFKPDDIEGPPAIVVDRATLSLDVQMVTLAVPVVVIGRRDGTEEAQTQLDDLVDLVVAELSGPDLAVVRVEPAVSTVAELTYPAYRVTVACGEVACMGDTQ